MIKLSPFCRPLIGISIVLMALSLSSAAIAQQHFFENNSTRKDRVQPSPQAQRIGSAVKWQPHLEAALAESAATGKPVFWYVPTLRRSFMDRVDSIDRYMMAGPFSWPDIIEMLNEKFVPVRAEPSRQEQTKFDLKPYVFVEPGFLILNSGGELVKKVDRMTTLHPVWIRHLLSGYIKDPPSPESKSAELKQLWKQFAAGQYEAMKFPNQQDASTRTEELLLAGMVEFRLGNHESAQQRWQLAAASQPDSPLAWKAAAEAEGFGPFVRGFEVHRELPAAALAAGNQSVGSSVPAGVYDADQLWVRGVDFLLGMQDQSGCWTDCDYDFGGADSLPNVHAAVTAIAGMALLKALERSEPDSPTAKKIANAIDRAARYVADDQHLNLADRDELLWAYVYRIRLLAQMTKRDPAFADSLKSAVQRLQAIQLNSGGWFHEYDNPFVTASSLLAFAEAASVGATADATVIEKGIASLARDRYGNGAFPYSSVPTGVRLPVGTDRNVAESAGRMPLCELALWTGKKSDNAGLVNAVQRSFDLNEHLMKALKYDDHTSNMAYGGFFFWYDFHGRSEAIANIADADTKARFEELQRSLILSLPEIDGCFVDSHELGRVYGTAMALLSLP